MPLDKDMNPTRLRLDDLEGRMSKLEAVWAEGDDTQWSARDWGDKIDGKVVIPEGVLEQAGLDLWQHLPGSKVDVNACCRALDHALPILLPVIQDQVIETLMEHLSFAGWDEAVLIPENEQGDPVTVGAWLAEYREHLRETGGAQ